MADNVNITGPIEISDNSKERVALDLMHVIFRGGHGNEYKSCDGILELYARCLCTIRYPERGAADLSLYK